MYQGDAMVRFIGKNQDFGGISLDWPNAEDDARGKNPNLQLGFRDRGIKLIKLYASAETWAPQGSGSSHNLALLEGVQRRATRFILQEFDLSDSGLLKTLILLPISHWLEVKDLL
jgi:hypothetical protein